jgi:regulator of cell morphogenesis and NO signaling
VFPEDIAIAIWRESAPMGNDQWEISDPDWSAAPLRSLIKHIVETHHAYLQKELPALDTLVGRIVPRGCEDSALVDLRRLIRHLRRDLELQMRKEEAILFPAILELEATVATGKQPEYSQFGSVANLSRVTAHDHANAVRTMEEIRQLTNNYTCSKDSDAGMLQLCRRLASLAPDLLRHIHLETAILFPRANNLERGDTPCR